ncbi:MAG: GNAT family N-acetyltransferase [Promethearchaeota archaeon]
MPSNIKQRILKDISIRYNLQPGDMGNVVSLHAVVYADEHGFDHTFEGYVASGIAEFAQSFNAAKDRLWVAAIKGQIIGSIAVFGRSESEAQLRWFLVHPSYRGLGLGKLLFQESLQFCKKCGFKSVFLWTFSGLDAARYLYISAGFKKTEEITHEIWGNMLTEERYDLHL